MGNQKRKLAFPPTLPKAMTITDHNNDKEELLQKLLDDDVEVEDIELTKEELPVIVAGIPVGATSTTQKATGKADHRQRSSGGCCRCLCKCVGITLLVFV